MSRYDKTQYIPSTIIWLTRISMIVIVYMYHTPQNLVNLVWIMLSFICSYKMLFLMTNITITPMLLLEFVMIYGNNIPSVRDSTFFKEFGGLFQLVPKNKIAEMTFLFFVLMLYSMMISCFVLEYKNQDTDKVYRFFIKRIRE
jgi:hypothetical protein